MNWGTKILIVYVAFVSGIVFMVVKSSTQNSDLVTKDYYEQELKYQDKIEQIKRTAALSAPVECKTGDNVITILFPGDFTGKKLVGEALVYCPSDQKNDFKKVFTVQDQALQIAIPEGRKGMYELHLNWQDGGVSYYFEKKIFL
jgi:hypothetical protein